MPTKRLNLATRKQVFAEVVAMQDGGGKVEDVRRMLADKHGITPHGVKQIENEGLLNDWPPIGDGRGLDQCKIGRM